MAKIMMNKKKYKGYTLKVSLSRKCYRNLIFPGNFTLEDLADMILTAFDFDNDHLHAFFMDGQPYSRGESYYSRYAEKDGISTDKIKVDTLGLAEKQKFLFLFDFGDDWQFTCEVKKITDTPEKESYITEIVGKAPEQYPEYDEDDDHDESEPISSYIPIEPELYKAAFEFKSSKPWKKLSYSDIFAVRFSDGNFGYAFVSGSQGGTFGIVLHTSIESISEIHDYLREPVLHENDYVGNFNFTLKQDCIMMTLDNKSDIEPEYVSEIQAYAKENGITLRGQKSFPHFLRCLPQRMPWSITDKRDRKYLTQALEAATEFSKRLENCDKSEFRFGEIPIIPLISKRKDIFSCGSTMLPKPVEKQYPELCTKQVFKKYNTKVELECKIINIPDAVYNEITKIPEYPVTIVTVETKSGYAIGADLLPYNYDISAEMLSEFINALSKNKIYPKTISVSDKRTKALLTDICSRCGVKLTVKDSLPALDEVVRELFKKMM